MTEAADTVGDEAFLAVEMFPGPSTTVCVALPGELDIFSAPQARHVRPV